MALTQRSVQVARGLCARVPCGVELPKPVRLVEFPARCVLGAHSDVPAGAWDEGGAAVDARAQRRGVLQQSGCSAQQHGRHFEVSHGQQCHEFPSSASQLQNPSSRFWMRPRSRPVGTLEGFKPNFEPAWELSCSLLSCFAHCLPCSDIIYVQHVRGLEQVHI